MLFLLGTFSQAFFILWHYLSQNMHRLAREDQSSWLHNPEALTKPERNSLLLSVPGHWGLDLAPHMSPQALSFPMPFSSGLLAPHVNRLLLDRSLPLEQDHGYKTPL